MLPSGEIQLRASESRAVARRRSERRRSFLSLICSLPLAADRAGRPPTLSSLADEQRVDSLLSSTAARDPVRATTTAAGPKAPGSRAAVLDERASGHALRPRAERKAAASKRDPRERSERSDIARAAPKKSGVALAFDPSADVPSRCGAQYAVRLGGDACTVTRRAADPRS